mmetsp:Transcript_11561/g.42285  ORF Transcript_11561/g.42285 Transcript_11561/m.42285 type:complete len:216 (-) Transcript_11561:826-1473(-)|eukprot:scaffold1930_cov346-Prasinococcus_capsulatus_cf.AAC.4
MAAQQLAAPVAAAYGVRHFRQRQESLAAIGVLRPHALLQVQQRHLQIVAREALRREVRHTRHQLRDPPLDELVGVSSVPQHRVDHLFVSCQHELPGVAQQLSDDEQRAVDGFGRRLGAQPSLVLVVEKHVPLQTVARLALLHDAQARLQCRHRRGAHAPLRVTQRRPDAGDEARHVVVEHLRGVVRQLLEHEHGRVAPEVHLLRLRLREVWLARL